MKRTSRRIVLWSLCCLGGAACGDETAAPATGAAPAVAAAEPKPTDPLLTVDGVTVTFADVAEGLRLFDRLDPVYSRQSKMQRILEEYALPLLFARREFAAERQRLLAEARALRAVAGNVVELEQQSRTMRADDSWKTPREVEIPIATFLFDPLNQGAVSEPIELPQGYMVVGCVELQRSVLVASDRCHAIQVPFLTHDATGYRQWRRDLAQRLHDKVTWVHPDYRGAMPEWLRLP